MKYINYRGKTLSFFEVKDNYLGKYHYVNNSLKTNLLELDKVEKTLLAKNEIFKKFDRWDFKPTSIFDDNFILVKDFNVKELKFGEFVIFNFNEYHKKGFFIYDGIIDIKNKMIFEWEEYHTTYSCEECPDEILEGDKIDKILIPTSFKDKNGNIIFDSDACIIDNEIYRVEGNKIRNTKNKKVFELKDFIDNEFYRCIQNKELANEE